MKKNLLILGLLVCTTGIAFADEAAVPNIDTVAPQQVEVQNQIDKTTFQNIQRNDKFNKDVNQGFRNKPQDKIKYDRTVNNNKYKNFDKRGKYQNDKFKGEYKGNRPDLRKGQKADIFAPQRKPLPNKFMGHRPPKRYGEFKGGQRPNIHKAHRPQINNYKRHSNNIKRPVNYRHG